MRKSLQIMLAIAVIFVGLPAIAGTQVLGVEIGVTTVNQMRQELSKKTHVEDSGTNEFAGGPMLKTDGAAYEIEGLTEVVYIFDDQKKLAGVIMDMSKGRFDSVFEFLNKKYKVTSQQRPFVGDQFARFKPADSFIEMDAPHMGFNMEVRYIRNDLMQKFKTKSNENSAAKKKSEAANF